MPTRCCLLFVAWILAAASARAQAPFTPGNLLVTSRDGRIVEWEPDGDFVQSFLVPHPRVSRQSVHEIAFDRNGRLVAYNGRMPVESPLGRAYVSVFDPGASSWTHYTHPGFSRGGCPCGGIGTLGPYAFASDHGFSPDQRGLIRFDLRDGSAIRFDDGISYRQVSVGLDGLVYGMASREPLRVFDPDTLELIAVQPLTHFGIDSQYHDAEIDGAGDIYTVGRSGSIFRYDPEGKLRARLDSGLRFTYDIALSEEDGAIAITSTDGIVALTDLSLAHFEQFRVTSNPTGIFVAFVPSPRILEVAVDVKPGAADNRVYLGSRGVIPVAILGSEAFDVLEIDLETLEFGPDGTAPIHAAGGHPEDVDEDGRTDWVLHFRIRESGLLLGDEEACVAGETLDGVRFEGCDAIRSVEPGRPPGVRAQNSS